MLVRADGSAGETDHMGELAAEGVHQTGHKGQEAGFGHHVKVFEKDLIVWEPSKEGDPLQETACAQVKQHSSMERTLDPHMVPG